MQARRYMKGESSSEDALKLGDLAHMKTGEKATVSLSLEPFNHLFLKANAGTIGEFGTWVIFC